MINVCNMYNVYIISIFVTYFVLVALMLHYSVQEAVSLDGGRADYRPVQTTQITRRGCMILESVLQRSFLNLYNHIILEEF